MKEEHSHTLPIGSKLEEFEVVSILGQGGFGITYKVKDKSGKFMAIKEYMPSMIATRSQNKTTLTCIANKDNDFEWGLKRFIGEVELLKKLNHIYIVKAYKYFQANGTAYFVMDFFEGETLDKHLEKNRGKQFSKDEILYIMMPIVEGLKAVHAQGFLHRDVAPDNIYLRHNDSSILIDFGASRNALGVKSQNISAIIKIGYSPVEQYTSKSKQNETTDLYAISAVIYEMITGDKPPESTFRQTEIFDDKDDPIENIVESYKSKFPLSFLETVEKGLKIRQKDRIQTIKEFQEGLVSEEDELPEDSTPQLVEQVEDPLPIGYRLNEFEILSVLYQGGFKITYKVLDTNINKIMVIAEYVMNFSPSRNIDMNIVPNSENSDTFEWGVMRFREEVRTLSKFNHPNIIKASRIFELNNTAYIVMEYHEGQTLEGYLNNNKNHKLTQDEILPIVLPVLNALKVIHQKGYLYRDIASDTIFLCQDNRPILIDFGASGDMSVDLDTRTIKFGYSPPEQYTSNSKQNETTDLYALSAVIYEMITREKPPESTDRQIAIFDNEDDPIEDITKNSEYRSRFSLSFLETVKKGLNIRQKDRVQSVEEFEEGLVKEDAVERDNNNALPIGYMLNEFGIVSILGQGGFGITYKVWDTKLNKFMVVKEYMPSQYILEELELDNENGKEKFIKDAKFLSKFQNIDIISDYKYFKANNTAYMVMDFYEGETLESYLGRYRNKNFSEEEILSVMMPIINGLKEIHQKDFFHRDITPDNIFLRANNTPLLIEFQNSRILVRNGLSIGYAPPEEYVTNPTINASTDIYYLSAVIYKMITGKRPPESTHRQSEIFSGDADPLEDITKNSEYRSRFSLSFLETVKKGLEIRQKDRVQSVEEFQRRLNWKSKLKPSKEDKNQIEEPTIPPTSISKASGKNKFLEFLKEWLVTIIILLTFIVTPIVGGLYLLFSASSSENIFFGIALIVIPISLIIYASRDN